MSTPQGFILCGYTFGWRGKSGRMDALRADDTDIASSPLLSLIKMCDVQHVAVHYELYL
jgi:hypothetical protein